MESKINRITDSLRSNDGISGVMSAQIGALKGKINDFIHTQNLPLPQTIETQKVLKKATQANRALAKLNGVAQIILNQNILINALVLQEAKDSSEIENIITTHDELFRGGLDIASVTNETKEVQHYREALLKGFALVQENGLLLKRNIIFDITHNVCYTNQNQAKDYYDCYSRKNTYQCLP